MRKYLRIVDKNKGSKWQRFFNYILDRVFIQVLFYGSFMAFGLIYAIIYGEEIPSESLEENTTFNILSALIYLIYYIGYFFCMEYFLGRTIAKFITGTKVISVDGNKPTSGQIFGRTFSRLVPFNSLSFLGENGWHDSWTETRVVDTKDYESEKQAKSEIDTLGTKEIA